VQYHGRTDGSENDPQRDADAAPRVLASHTQTQWKREGMTAEKIGLILLTLMLIPLVLTIGPQALGALAGAAALTGMLRIVGLRMNRE